MFRFLILGAIFVGLLGAHEFCEECGMSLETHQKSSHILKNGENIEFYACSLHCALNAKNLNSSLKDAIILGFDNLNNEYVELDSLFYVIGSNKKSAMTKESEFALSSKQAAQDFISESGGRIIAGSEILAYEASKIESDNERIRISREKLKESGESIAKEYCDIKTIQKTSAKNIAELKTLAKKHCGNIDENGLHAVSIYLWGK